MCVCVSHVMGVLDSENVVSFSTDSSLSGRL